MAKINPPLRMRKAITGYKSIRPVKSDTEQYTVQTNAGATEADVSDTSGDIIGSVSGTGLKNLMQKVREGLVSLGVKFPILAAANVPFGDFEVQLMEFSEVPLSGAFSLSFNAVESSSISSPVTADAVELALRSISGLEAVTVTGDSSVGFTVTFTGVPGDINLLEEEDNTLAGAPTAEIQDLTFSEVPDTGIFRLDYDGTDTEDINFDASAGDIQTEIRLIAGLGDVTVAGDFSTGFQITMTGVVAPLLLQVTDNTLEFSATPVSTDVQVIVPYAPGAAVTITVSNP